VAADDDAASENRPAPAPLRVSVLVGAPAALRRRALRLWLAEGRGGLRRIESAHVLAVERLLEGERGGRVAELPGGGRVERRRGRLYFRREKD
jgi:tRNA(Ile)-lysidine synthase